MVQIDFKWSLGPLGRSRYIERYPTMINAKKGRRLWFFLNKKKVTLSVNRLKFCNKYLFICFFAFKQTIKLIIIKMKNHVFIITVANSYKMLLQMTNYFVERSKRIWYLEMLRNDRLVRNLAFLRKKAPYYI